MKPDLSPWPVDQPIPAACTIHDVCRICRMALSQFYALKRIKSLPAHIKLLPNTGRGRRPLYCGRTLAMWVSGERRAA